jgi:hypothetical protein
MYELVDGIPEPVNHSYFRCEKYITSNYKIIKNKDPKTQEWWSRNLVQNGTIE